MTIDWEIGKEARELDEKSVFERMRIGKQTIIKMIVALMFYSITMILFYIFL